MNVNTMLEDLLSQFYINYEQYNDMFVIKSIIVLFDHDMIDDRIKMTVLKFLTDSLVIPDW